MGCLISGFAFIPDSPRGQNYRGTVLTMNSTRKEAAFSPHDEAPGAGFSVSSLLIELSVPIHCCTCATLSHDVCKPLKEPGLFHFLSAFGKLRSRCRK